MEEETVLRKIAEAALSATGAAGAALALRRGGSVLCVARAGEMGPPLGAHLDDRSGMSGDCLRQGHALRCDDTETDTRVDTEACRSLGLRSLAVAAIRERDQVIGILEVFSPHPATFTEQHVEILRQLAELVIEDLEAAPVETARPGRGQPGAETQDLIERMPPQLVLATPVGDLTRAEETAQLAPSATLASRSTEKAERTSMSATPLPDDVNIAAYMAAHEKAQSQIQTRVPKLVLIGLATLVVAFMMGWYRPSPKSVSAAAPPAATAPSALASSGPDTVALVNLLAKPSPAISAAPVIDPAESKAALEALTNAASLDRIANTAGQVAKPIRVVPNPPASTAKSDTALELDLGNGGGKSNETLSSLLSRPVALPLRALPVSRGVEGGELEFEVATVYPAEARFARQQGTVVLRAMVSEDGSVRNVKVISGPPLLRRAAADAVRLRKYKPYKLNGQPISAQTEVKLEFKLP
jgi:protein TonB